MYEGRPHYNIGLNAVAGKRREDYGVDPTGYDNMRKGCYDPKARLEDMDVDGIQAQLCFPTFPGFAGSTFFAATDKDLAAACVRAYNDWMIDEWCAAMPGRQIPLALLPLLGHRRHRGGSRAGRGEGRQGLLLPRAAPCARPPLLPHRPLGPVPRGRRGGEHARSASTSDPAARRPSRPRRRSPPRSRCSASTRRCARSTS